MTSSGSVYASTISDDSSITAVYVLDDTDVNTQLEVRTLTPINEEDIERSTIIENDEQQCDQQDTLAQNVTNNEEIGELFQLYFSAKMVIIVVDSTSITIGTNR